MKSGSSRRLLLIILVVVFGFQTAFVYRDPIGYSTPPLSELGLKGREIWHDNNCQSCHQIYGFGGFLGPDLTNMTERVSRNRLDSILTEGAAQMPAFAMSSEEIDAIEVFLAEIGATGLGQPTPLLGDPVELLDDLVGGLSESGKLNGTQEIGRALVKGKLCIGCHLPNLQSSHRAPDLTKLVESPGREGILSTVTEGRKTRGMPAFHLATAEEDGLFEFLSWLNESRDSICAGFVTAEGRSRTIPWFEYR